MDDLISRSALIKKMSDTNIEIMFDLPVEELLGEDVDMDDFCTLLQDAIQAYRKLVIGEVINKAPTVDAVPVVWKEVKGFEGLYEVSTLGKVRNSKGKIKKHGIKRTSGTCYKTVRLWKDGKYYNKYVHRLIAEAFIPNPEKLPFINHKDEDGTNNSIENLEWCTKEYNNNYGTARKRQAKKVRGKESEKRKVVYQYTLDGDFVACYPSVTHAAKELGCSTSEIAQVCIGKRKTSRGFIWEYENCGAKMDGKKVQE